MPAAYLDRSLATLTRQLKAKFPGVVIGWIGDVNHNPWPESDHSPEPDGSVDAIDPMIGPKFTTKNAQDLVNALIHFNDDRIAYIIWNGRIWKESTGWRKYNGKDPHTNHIHISRNDKNESASHEWKIAIPAPPKKEDDVDLNDPLVKSGKRYDTGWDPRTVGDVLADLWKDVHGPNGVLARQDELNEKLGQVITLLTPKDNK